MDGGLAGILDRLPAGTLAVLGAGADYAFLIGPAMLSVMLLRRWHGGADAFRIHTGEVVLAGLASITAAAFFGTAGIVGTFQDIGTQGGAGLGTVTNAVVGATKPVVWAVVSTVICLLAFAVLTLVSRRRGSSDNAATAAPSARRAFGWSVLLAGVVFAVDRLLRLHHEMTDWLVVLLGPPTPEVTGQYMLLRSEEIIPPLLASGFLLSAVVLILTMSMWRASRARAAHPLLTWASSVALVAVLVGGAWHANIVNRDLQKYQAGIEKMTRMQPR